VLLKINEREEQAMKVKMVKVESSQIEAVGYDEETGTMCVVFKSHNPAVAGSMYDYKDVPAEEFERFMKSESKGKHFGEFIKPRYAYRQACKCGDEQHSGKWQCLKAVKYKGGCKACRISECLDTAEKARQHCALNILEQL
jgi:hypothetical protein